MMLGYMMPSPRPARHLLSSTCHSEELSAASTMPARKGSVDTCGEEMRRYTDIMFRVYTGQLVTIKTTRRPSRSDRAPPREQPRMLVKAQHEAATEIYL